MAIFTKDQFRSAVSSLSERYYFPNVLNEARSYSDASSNQKTIFLSHSHHDAEYVSMAKTFFEHLDIGIYVDWADSTMPKRTCGETARKIKAKIYNNEFFVLLATNLAVSSKWCNWEVGVGDVYKAYPDKMLILPLSDNSFTWQGNEYLQTYPYIKAPEYSFWNNDPTRYMVCYPDGHEISLLEWLRKG